MWDRNPDGFGIMYAVDGRIHASKSLGLKGMYKKYKYVWEKHGNDTDIVLHFRIGTQGENDIANCHPFKITDALWFCHNGVISDFSPMISNAEPLFKDMDYTKSDTRLFNDYILKAIPTLQDEIDKPATKALLSEYVSGSKLVFLKNDGTTTIINEKSGNKSTSGDWYSNTGWKTYKANTNTNYNTAQNYGKCLNCGESHWIGVDKNSYCFHCKKIFSEIEADAVSGNVYPKLEMVLITYQGRKAWIHYDNVKFMTGEELVDKVPPRYDELHPAGGSK
jgi:predicted glutamine amidotransferase